LKRRSCIAIFLSVIVAIVFCNFTPSQAKAAEIDRIWGSNRYETASKIALEGWETSKYAILVTGENYPDALAATPLSKKLDAPILLTEKNRLTEITLNTMKLLQVSEVFIIGGTGVVSTNVYYALINHGLKPKRISGANRYETSLEIAKLLGVSKGIFAVYGGDFADALSVGPVAASLGMPIILTRQKKFKTKM
jgi:Putative cell wall-binding domain